ncbi:MAG: threonine-phosphate decarboxylase CobD [Candidatus Scalinduaceae bacterium]
MINGHGGNINKLCNAYGLNPDEVIDFSASINPLGYPNSVRKVILERFDDILNYPDSECTNLRKAIAEKHSCNESNIIVGNGSNELFYLIPRALKPKQGIILQPTFSEFKDALLNANTDVIEIINDINKELSFDLNNTRLRSFKEGIVFLCNPNNPTGQLIKKNKILKLAKDDSKRLIVVDEAFMDFVEDAEKYSVIKEAHLMRNLIVVRSLTKFYGFPGLRLGYLIACETITKKILPFKEPWTVNALAQVAGQVAVNDKEFAFNTKKFISVEKVFLYEGLTKIDGLHPFYPSANFILVRIDNDGIKSSRIHDLLIKDKIAIRDCSNFVGLNDRYFRVAARTREENQRLLSALKLATDYRISEGTSRRGFAQEFVAG